MVFVAVFFWENKLFFWESNKSLLVMSKLGLRHEHSYDKYPVYGLCNTEESDWRT